MKSGQKFKSTYVDFDENIYSGQLEINSIHGTICEGIDTYDDFSWSLIGLLDNGIFSGAYRSMKTGELCGSFTFKFNEESKFWEGSYIGIAEDGKLYTSIYSMVAVTEDPSLSEIRTISSSFGSESEVISVITLKVRFPKELTKNDVKGLFSYKGKSLKVIEKMRSVLNESEFEVRLDSGYYTLDYHSFMVLFVKKSMGEVRLPDGKTLRVEAQYIPVEDGKFYESWLLIALTDDVFDNFDGGKEWVLA